MIFTINCGLTFLYNKAALKISILKFGNLQPQRLISYEF